MSDAPLFCFAAALCCTCRPCNRTPRKMPDATAPHAEGGLCFERGCRPRDRQSDTVASRLSARVSLVAAVSVFLLKRDCHTVRPRISLPPRWVLILEPESQHSVMPDLCANPPPQVADWPLTEEEGSDFSSALRGMCESGRSSSQDCLLIFSCQFSPPINSLRSPRRCLWPVAIQGRRQGLKVMPGF